MLDLIREFNLTLEEALEVSDHMPIWGEFSVYEGGQPGRLATRPDDVPTSDNSSPDEFQNVADTVRMGQWPIEYPLENKPDALGRPDGFYPCLSAAKNAASAFCAPG